MKEKTKLFKMIASIVCIMMLLTMFSTYSFADIGSSDKATITINKLEPGIDLTAYQLTTVNYDFDNNQLIEPPYSWVAPIKTWLHSHDTYSIYENDLKKFEEDMNASTDTKKAFYSALTAAIKDSTITGLTTKTTTASGTLGDGGYPEKDEQLTESATFSDLDMGTYLIVIEGGYRIYEPVVVNAIPQAGGGSYTLPAVSADVKSSTPTISKKVNGQDKDSVSTKDVINYEITADVPTYLPNTIAKKYYISDKLSTGLVLHTDSIKVYGYDEQSQEGNKETLLTADTHYTLTTENAQRPVADDNQNVTFSINFNYDQISSYEKIIVRYEANLDTSVQPGTGYSNKAFLDYSNNPYVDDSFKTQETGTDGDPDTPDDPNNDVTVFTYGIEVTKVDKANPQTKLTGAEFALSLDGQKLKFTKVADGVYYQSESGVESMAVDSNGVLKIYGLDTDIYTLEETKAPAGYNKATETKEITLADKPIDGVLDDDSDGVYAINFTNSQGFQLPETGGIGTTIFVACGIVFLGIGIGLMFVAIKKRNVK